MKMIRAKLSLSPFENTPAGVAPPLCLRQDQSHTYTAQPRLCGVNLMPVRYVGTLSASTPDQPTDETARQTPHSVDRDTAATSNTFYAACLEL